MAKHRENDDGRVMDDGRNKRPCSHILRILVDAGAIDTVAMSSIV
jgi:hypothetical protein